MCTRLKNISVEIPTMTSGKIIGRYVTPSTNFRPRNLYQLQPIAASEPSNVETAADVKATMRLFKSASHNDRESKMSALYHLSERRVKSAPLLSLNEYVMITTSGKNKKTSVSASITFANENIAARFFHDFFACRAGSDCRRFFTAGNNRKNIFVILSPLP